MITKILAIIAWPAVIWWAYKLIQFVEDCKSQDYELRQLDRLLMDREPWRWN